MSSVKRLYKEIFYLDNYVNIIRGVDIVKKNTKFSRRNTECFYKIKELGVMDIIFTEKRNLFSETGGVLALDLIFKNKKRNIVFSLNGYPYRCPRVIFNNDTDIYCKMYKYNKYFDITNCICRNSIVCSNNWHIYFLLSNIILEYVTYYQKYISRIEDKYNCNLYICYCKLGFYLPIADFL